jgi:hypothetical protein
MMMYVSGTRVALGAAGIPFCSAIFATSFFSGSSLSLFEEIPELSAFVRFNTLPDASSGRNTSSCCF